MISILIEKAISHSMFLIELCNRYLSCPILVFNKFFMLRTEEQHENSRVGQPYGYCHGNLQQLIAFKVNTFYNIFYIMNFRFIFSCF